MILCVSDLEWCIFDEKIIQLVEPIYGGAWTRTNDGNVCQKGKVNNYNPMIVCVTDIEIIGICDRYPKRMAELSER